MPTYEYQCTQCTERLEAVQSFTDAALEECPKCGEPTLRKLFGNVGVVFKGSGFYRNDSREENRRKSKTTEKSESGSKEAKSGSDAAKSDSGSGPATKPGTDSGGKSGSSTQESKASSSGSPKKSSTSSKS